MAMLAMVRRDRSRVIDGAQSLTAAVNRELKRKHVTLQVLDEYIELHPDGYRFNRFGAGKQVMVRDDDDAVRAVIVEALSAAGFEVLEARGWLNQLRGVPVITIGTICSTLNVASHAVISLPDAGCITLETSEKIGGPIET